MSEKSEKFEKFAFENEFFDVAVMDGLVANPKMPTTIKAAQEEGFKEGLAKGRAEGDSLLQQELQSFKTQVDDLMQKLNQQHEEWKTQLADQALSLMRVSLHRLVGHAAENYSDQMLEHHLRHLLTLLHQGDGLNLRVHPQAKHYHEKLGLPQASISNIPFKIVTDPTLGPTDVVMEWSGGGLESKLTEHLADLDKMLEQAGSQPLETPPPPTESKLQQPENETPLSGKEDNASDEEEKSKSRAEELLGDDELVDALK